MIVGRPLRFLALVTGGWVAARAMLLWPVAPVLADAERAIVPRVTAAPKALAVVVAPPPRARWIAALAAVGSTAPPRAVAHLEPASPPPPPSRPTPIAARETGIIAGLPMPLPTPAQARPAKPPSRFFGSAWLFVRGGGGPAGGLGGPQLGGSQAGMRLAYALTADRRLALAARFAAPLGQGQRDLALGVEWQPTRLPIRVIAEQRIALGKGRGGATLGLVGGAGPLPIAAGFDLEAYAQAGIIARGSGEGYADAAARLARPLARLGKVRLDLGAGAWGAAQQGASRIDIGPSLTVHVPIGAQPVRLSLDWRQRVAGNATPGSGLVLSVGADF